SPRLRASYDLRTTPDDNSQRILNALMPGTKVPVHRHPHSAESVVCVVGCLDEIILDDNGAEIERYRLNPQEGRFGCQIPAGAWHTVEVFEPSVILEAKDGRYNFDDTETLH
ncbi:MAG: WbuC family cupin fold metalloprotein, partial [Muribaculaceae bacterium]|nr:WbuC family cupin fold metalloprotein [Muribaculaceae bacterium]